MDSTRCSGRGDFHTVYKGQSVDDLVIQCMEENNVPGMVLSIVQAPYITRVVGYGIADIKTKRLVATRTVFNVGQLTNAFTAVAIMQLKETAKLQLDDLISSHLSNLPDNWHSITIRELLTHSSGIPDYTQNTAFNYAIHYEPHQIISLINNVLLFKPGTQMQMSATNHYLLGWIVEKSSGMSYQDYVTKNQIERMGLKNTFFVDSMSLSRNDLYNK